jgi:arylsulfatase A-like enzyme
VLIIGDDISVDDFGCYGHPRIRTPNVDKLAANGVRFTNAYLTTSQCSPTRSSVITGRYPHNTGAPELHTALPAGQVMFPALLKQTGYYTTAAENGTWATSQSEPSIRLSTAGPGEKSAGSNASGSVPRTNRSLCGSLPMMPIAAGRPIRTQHHIRPKTRSSRPFQSTRQTFGHYPGDKP